MATDNDYEVGYGRPPKHTRFKPGQSGNPNGRPKGTKNFTTQLREELAEEILVTENGQQRKISKLEALTKSAVSKGLKGNVPALRLLFGAIADIEQRQSTDVDSDALRQEDQEILDTYVQRRLEEREAEAEGDAP